MNNHQYEYMMLTLSLLFFNWIRGYVLAMTISTKFSFWSLDYNNHRFVDLVRREQHGSLDEASAVGGDWSSLRRLESSEATDVFESDMGRPFINWLISLWCVHRPVLEWSLRTIVEGVDFRQQSTKKEDN